MDITRLLEDSAKLVADFNVVVADVMLVVEDLRGMGIDPQPVFASFAGGPLMLSPLPEEVVGKVDWQRLIELAKKYGPALYAILSTIFGWPPIPIPIPISE